MKRKRKNLKKELKQSLNEAEQIKKDIKTGKRKCLNRKELFKKLDL